MATVQELEAALRNADAAGDEDAANQIADAIRALPAAEPAAPQSNPLGQFAAGAVEGTVGIPGDIRAAVGMKPQTTQLPQGDFWHAMGAGVRNALSAAPTSRDINARLHLPTEAATTMDKYARTAGAFAPGALLPGSAIARVARVTLPAVASETAGQVTAGTPLEVPARILGGLGGGVASEGVSAALENAGRAIAKALPFTIDAAPSQLNSIGAGVRVTPKGPRPADISRTLAALAERGGGIEGVRARAQPYRDAGMQPRVFQALGESGARRAQTLASAPGQTPQLARDVADATHEGIPARIADAADTAFGATPREAAVADLAASKSALAPHYNTLLDGATIAQPVWNARFAPILQRLKNSGDLPAALSTAQANAARDGLAFESLGQPRQMQLLKVALDDRINRVALDATTGPATKRSLVKIKNELIDALESAVPGYKALNAKWRDVSAAQELLGEGGESAGWAADFFSTAKSAYRPPEVAAEFRRMTPLQQDAALASLRNEILRQAEAKGGVAAPLLSNEMQAKLRLVLRDKGEPFIRSLRLAKNDLADMGYVSPRKYAAAQQGFDAMDMAAALPKAGGRPVSATLDWLGKQTIGKIVDPVAEQHRNRLGAQLFDQLTPEFEDELANLLAKRSAQRGARRAGVAATGIEAGARGSR